MLKFIPSEVYAALSFRQGAFPDFDRLAGFFLPEAVFINNKGDVPQVKQLHTYINMVESLIDDGTMLSLRETEIEQTCQVYGKVAQINSAYELVFSTPEGVFTRYGVNLFQLVKCDNRWLITSMCWDDRPDETLHKQLPKGAGLHKH